MTRLKSVKSMLEQLAEAGGMIQLINLETYWVLKVRRAVATARATVPRPEPLALTEVYGGDDLVRVVQRAADGEEPDYREGPK